MHVLLRIHDATAQYMRELDHYICTVMKMLKAADKSRAPDLERVRADRKNVVDDSKWVRTLVQVSFDFVHRRYLL